MGNMQARDMLGDQEFLAEATILNDNRDHLLQQKWAEMLEGINDPWMRRCTAQILENEMVHMTFASKRLQESSMSQNIPDLVKFIFPLIRKVWPNLIANGLCSLQPMNSPIGGIFFWDYKYGTTKGKITAGMKMIENFDENYSSEYVDSEVVGAGPAANFVGALAWSPVKAWGLGQMGIEFIGYAGAVMKRIYDADGTGTLIGNIGAPSTVVYANGNYNITFDVPVTNVIANYFYNMEGVANNVPEVNVDIQLEAVKAYSRKLKYLWSSEIQDDMQAILGMNIEPEMSAGVANEIQLGIDREMIMAMYSSGTTNTESWDAAVPPGRNQVDHYRNITTVLGKVSGEINKRLKRGPGNFIVMGPSVQPIFEALYTHGDLKGIYQPDAGTHQGQGRGTTGRSAFPLPAAPSGYGVYVMGMLQAKWTVIVDPFFPTGKILVGLKGPAFPDAGLVYAPYVPLEMTGAFLDPADFTLRKGMRTRYTKKLVNNNFYGVVTVSNLP